MNQSTLFGTAMVTMSPSRTPWLVQVHGQIVAGAHQLARG